MKITLTRFPSGETETQGILQIGKSLFTTMEQEARFTKRYPYGVPRNSCIPTGEYKLLPFRRPNGSDTWCIVNPDLGVYMFQHEVGNATNRYLCIIHPGNFSFQTEGCILPGMAHKQLFSKSKQRILPAATLSKMAFTAIQKLLIPGTEHELEIKNFQIKE